jgi:hypothetical protein
MPYFIFNDSTGKQRSDFYTSQISEDILWQGESLEVFESETGFSIAQLGGFKLSKGKLTYSQALKDAYDAPQQAVQTPLDKLRELTAFVVNGIDTQGDAETDALKQAVLAILEA